MRFEYTELDQDFKDEMLRLMHIIRQKIEKA
jgi:hypothetical protein